MAKEYEVWVKVDEVRYVPGQPPEYSLSIYPQSIPIGAYGSQIEGNLTIRGELGVEGDLTEPIKMTMALAE